MSEPNGPVCPECGTPRASDGTPACACARRASDARRDARAAERAAAEDFDPVRIRRFVELGDDAGADRNGDGDGDAQETRDLADPDADAPPALPPSARTTPDEPPPVDTVDPRSKRRRTLLITGAGATLAVLLTGAFLGGLFTYDSPSRGGAVSDDIREPIPEGSAEDGTAPEGQSSGTASASPSRSESPSPSTTAGDSPAATPSAPATPTATPSSAAPTTSTAPEPSAPEGEPPVLRLGDQGPEVTELQLRLNQIGLYAGDADGTYDRQVESAVSTYQFTRVILSDESGVYGRATRTALESETSEP
ncbi:peptidoglycan-binding domain-containing protein [Streptomyces lanatus]|uniref:Peptidoglycan-binding protein n=1 Tax=Streptomyces lanatus TaxID=66900 RepID=A0ABV1Y7B6_9ACTN|nr:peptidoglycan-binding domain-containing protein [Streptomyces lanatus]